MKQKFSNYLQFILLTILITQSQQYLVFSPFEVSYMKTEEFQTSGIFDGEYAIVTASTAGVYFYNVLDPKNPISIKNVKEDGDTCFDVKSFVQENQNSQIRYYLVSNGENGLCMYRITITGQDENGPIYDIKRSCYNLDDINIRSSVQLNNDKVLITGPEYIGLVQVQLENSFDQNPTVQLIQKWFVEDRTNIRGYLDLQKRFFFVADKEYTRIYDVNKILNQDSDPLVLVKMYSEDVIKVALINNENENIMYVLDTNGGIYLSDISALYTQSSVTESDITKESLIFYPQIHSIALAQNNRYLLIGIRSRGIEIYDIIQRNKPYLSENLHSIGYSTALYLSEDEQKLLYCNGDFMKIYEQITPNLSINFPNLFNGNKSKRINLEINRAEKFPWRIKMTSDSNYIYIAGGRNGLLMYDISVDPLNPQLIGIVEPTRVTTPTDGCSISNDENYLFVGEGTQGVKIVDISNKNNPVELSHVVPVGDTDDIQITNDNNYMILGSGSEGIYVYDIQNKAQPQEFLKWQNNKLGGSIENVAINKNNTLIFGSLRYYGFVVLELNIENQSFEEIAEYQTGMCEQIVLSSDEKYAFLSDGTFGITIVDIQDLQNITKINSVLLGGFPAKMRLIQYQEKYDYLLIAQRDKELIAGVNVTDIYNPELVIKFEIENEQAFDLECLQNKQYCYIVMNKGMRILPMQTKIDIHKQFVEIERDEKTNKEKLVPIEADLLPIGKEVEIMLIPLRAGGKIKIKDIFHYYNYKLTQIPNYMAFDKANLKLELTVDKAGINNGKEVQPNILLVELVKFISAEAFINTNLGIDLAMSQNIREHCVDFGYLTVAYFLHDDFNPDIKLFQGLMGEDGEDFYNSQIQEHVKFILEDSKILIPLILNFAQSLFFRPNNPELKVIQSLSSTLNIELQLAVKPNDFSQLSHTINTQSFKNGKVEFAEFVKKQYTSSLVDKHTIQIQGQKEVVLRVLTEQLLLQNYTDNRQDITFIMSIDDNLNHNQQFFSDYQECNFLHLHKGVQQNDESLKLQTQFDSVYDGGDVYITEDFIFQFSDKTFQSSAGLPITYDILLLMHDDDDYHEIEAGFWIEVLVSERKVKGTPPISQYNKGAIIKVIATDGYSVAEDSIKINFSKIPTQLIIEYIILIGSPILTILGLYEFRGRIWMVVFRQRYEYGRQTVKDGEEFKMQLILALDQLKETGPIVEQMIKDLKKQKKPLMDFFDGNKFCWKRREVLKYIFNIIDTNPKFYKLRSRAIYKNGLNSTEDSYLFILLKCKLFYKLLLQNKETHKLYKKIVKWAQRRTNSRKAWYQYLIEVQYRDVTEFDRPLPYFKFIKKNIYEMIRCNCEMEGEQGLTEYLHHMAQGRLGGRRDEDQAKCYFYNVEFQKQVNQYQQQLKNQNICLKLILQVLIGDGYGFNLRVNKYIQTEFSRGISLLCEIKNVYVVKALIKDSQGCIRYFPRTFKLFNAEYTDIPMISNSPLPPWLNYQYHHDIIDLYGTWDPNESDEIMIRIENNFEVIMKEFILVRKRNKQRSPSTIVQIPEGTHYSFNRQSSQLNENFMDQHQLSGPQSAFEFPESINKIKSDVEEDDDDDEDSSYISKSNAGNNIEQDKSSQQFHQKSHQSSYYDASDNFEEQIQQYEFQDQISQNQTINKENRLDQLNSVDRKHTDKITQHYFPTLTHEKCNNNGEQNRIHTQQIQQYSPPIQSNGMSSNMSQKINFFPKITNYSKISDLNSIQATERQILNRQNSNQNNNEDIYSNGKISDKENDIDGGGGLSSSALNSQQQNSERHLMKRESLTNDSSVKEIQNTKL